MAPELRLSQHPDADRLLSEDPLALLIGMVLDQQIPLERAFRSPYDLKERLGGRLEAEEIASMDPDQLARVFAQPPALHRFWGSNAKRVQDLCRIVIDEYGGRAEGVWKSAGDGAELVANLRALPGFGEQKAKIFAALLGKQLGVQPPGWRQAAGDYAAPGSHVSVADIDGPESLALVRHYKKEKKAAAKAAAAAADSPLPAAKPTKRQSRA